MEARQQRRNHVLGHAVEERGELSSVVLNRGVDVGVVRGRDLVEGV